MLGLPGNVLTGLPGNVLTRLHKNGCLKPLNLVISLCDPEMKHVYLFRDLVCPTLLHRVLTRHDIVLLTGVNVVVYLLV